MSYRERYWIVFNGEIFNYRELKVELEMLGHAFGSDSDTEVILAAYAQWGTDCLSHLNGMWAFAIYDAQRKSLFLARDRFGIKPVYYTFDSNRFAFASEIKAFATMRGWRPKANTERILDFLAWNISDHTADTMFDGVSQLKGGHFVLLDASALLEGGGAQSLDLGKPVRWYSIGEKTLPRSADAAADLGQLLRDAVRLRMRSDVPVGSCLSGGIDSSSIVCIMSEQLKRAGLSGNIKTFTAKSHDSAFDESRFAIAAAASSSVEAHFVTPDPDGLLSEIDRLAWHQDEPFGSTSIFAQWSVFKLARQNDITVMLDGQGADEILCGYRGFFGAYLAGLVKGGHLVSWLGEIGAMRRQIGFSAARSLGYTAAYLAPTLLQILGRFDQREYGDRGWIEKPYREAFHSDPVRSLGGRSSSAKGMSIALLDATNLPRLLHWEDRNSMAFSVEARVPFLDYRVVELCLGMSDFNKLGGGVSKRALRASMRGLVPDLILDRRDKLGFVTSEPLWMTQYRPGQFRRELDNALKRLSGIVSPSLRDRFDEMVAGNRPFDGRYWRVISLARWMSVFSVSL
jgi:asparagine synthase (glutamine-hydrolysing)